jgi:hypothetical protein
LEYIKKGGNWTKKRSFFYRPEMIANPEMWKTIRNGNEVEI